ncbi:hypothetical protein [Micromonospora endolithica]|uniref:hypothetical protein n=1 Tax=Micromonospora endolithica TaxID=230091 RepID=UPI0013151F56
MDDALETRVGVGAGLAPLTADVVGRQPGAASKGEDRVVGFVGGAELAGQEHADGEPGRHDHSVAGVASESRAVGRGLALDEDERAADRQGGALGGEVQVLPSQGDVTDADAGGEHEVDDVGEVAVVSWPGPAGDEALPVADRRPDGLKVFVGEGDDGAAGFA